MLRLLPLLLVLSTLLFAGPTVNEIESELGLFDTFIKRMELAHPWIAGLEFTILFVTFAVALVQIFERKPWAPGVTKGLAGFLAFVTAYKTLTFGVDSRTCDIVSLKGRQTLNALRQNIQEYRSSMDETRLDRVINGKKILDDMRSIMEATGRPPFALMVIHAQNAGANATAMRRDWGSALCDSPNAAFQMARHDAIDRLIRGATNSEAPDPALVSYIRARANVVSQSCKTAGAKGWQECQVVVEIPRIYFNQDLVAEKGKATPKFQPAILSAYKAVPEKDSFELDGKTASGEKFDLRLRRILNANGTTSYQATQLKLENAPGTNDYLLQFTIDGQTATVPVTTYGLDLSGGKETHCDVSRMQRKITVEPSSKPSIQLGAVGSKR